ncbi:MAG TPA: methyl-accepting chemotaxis protein [Thermoanaerobaculia bacterium]|nr:methyl-accepting chemotaxis protein [Thermoanaerobaculia bacterium]
MHSARRQLLGWLLLAGLTAAGAALLASAARATPGAAPWPFRLYLGLALALLVAYGLAVDAHTRRLAARLGRGEERLARLQGELAVAFSHLGAGDLLRGGQGAAELPAGIARTFTAAGEALSTLAEQIQDSSIQVAAAADDVNEVANELAAGSSQQAASVVEITAAMEELAQTAAQIAGNTARQAELAEAAERSGEAGAAAVGEAVAGVEEVQRRIGAIALRADALGTRSKEIYRVLELITEIAQETHILSLNAAIEAAAAGDQGRRFAVVAGEVRRLADRAQESVDSVRAMLDEFAGSIRATIVATEEGGKETARVLERGRAAAAAIGALRETAGETARAARQISLATQQQTSASDEVVATLREVAQVVQRMTRGLEELGGTAARLNHLGLSIQLVAQTFHSDSPRSLKHLIEAWSHRLDGSGGAEAAARLDELVQGTPFIEMGYLADADGRLVVLCHSKKLLGDRLGLSEDKARQVDMKQRPWFRVVARERRTSLTTLYDSLQSGELCFTVATPMNGADGAFRGVLGMDVNLTSWTQGA